MPTYTALTTLAGTTGAEALGEAMERLTPEPTGVGVFEVEDGSDIWEIGGYFNEKPDVTGLALLSATFGADAFVVSELPEVDWVAHVRRELPPVVAGRFFVYGNHDADKVPTDKVALLIEAAMAFGTGHHGTTLGCLRAFDRLLTQGVTPAKVADIGCGTAVLAIAAAKVLTAEVLASDIDQVAVDVSLTNMAANGLEGRVTCVAAAGFAHPKLAKSAPFDLVFANILKGPLVGLAPDMARNLVAGGRAILSGILNEQADDVLAVYVANGFELAHREEIVEWTTLTLVKET
jgi:ribosomal protein L11 methyltransferase